MTCIKLLTICMLTTSLCIHSYGQDVTEKNLKSCVYYLADDKLEGRATSSVGSELAGKYIMSQFSDIGLIPIGDAHTYLQHFDVNFGKTQGLNNYIYLVSEQDSNRLIYINTDNNTTIYPLNFSGNGYIHAPAVFCGYGIVAPKLNYDDYKTIDVKNKIAIIKVSTPEGSNPHSAYFNYIDERDKVDTALKKGAVGVLFINDDKEYPDIEKDYSRTITPCAIPVMYCTKDFAYTISQEKNISLSVELNQVIKPAYNICGYIDNHAANTVVIGAHYDHLGYGEIEGSLYRGAPAIHNGADDNASGVSLIIELARKLKSSDLKNNNYIIVAFSGEEMGLFGSKAFINSDAVKNYTINYMLNFDMVGRMDSLNDLIVNGVGTSPQWRMADSIHVNAIKIKTTESGIGPSDQTSFYLKNIPVLFFFTGSHSDYHKPTDDADKINYKGIEMVMNYTYALMQNINTKGKIEFTKTKDDANDDVPRFTVTLGLIPDYAFNGKGMRIDGITEGKPAQKAGLTAGDIIIKLGDNTVDNLTGYMKALSKFNKGDKTTVTVMRVDSEITVQVEF